MEWKGIFKLWHFWVVAVLYVMYGLIRDINYLGYDIGIFSSNFHRNYFRTICWNLICLHPHLVNFLEKEKKHELELKIEAQQKQLEELKKDISLLKSVMKQL